MKQFLNRLHELVSLGTPEQALKLLLDALGRYELSAYQTQEDISELKTQIVLLSARLSQLLKDEAAKLIQKDDAETSKNQIMAAFLNTINSFSSYPALVAFLNENEEENAWADATTQNTIDGYQSYFEQYPNGKYKRETEKVIAELKVINAEKEKEIRHRAEVEKQRRKKQTQEENVAEMRDNEVEQVVYNQPIVVEQTLPESAAQQKHNIIDYVILGTVTIIFFLLSASITYIALIYPVFLLLFHFLAPNSKYAKYAMPLLKMWAIVFAAVILYELIPSNDE